MLFVSSTDPGQSLYVYPCSLASIIDIYHMSYSFVPYNYLSLLLIALKWIWLGLCINLDNRLVAYIISSLIVVRYSNLFIKLLNVDVSSFLYPSAFYNFPLVMSGVAITLHPIILNFFRRLLVYFFCKINISSFSWLIFIRKKWCIKPKFIFSKVFITSFLNYWIISLLFPI